MSEWEIKSRVSLLKNMNSLMCMANDESITMTWLMGGVPDGADESDYLSIAKDTESFKGCYNLFCKLIQRKGYL